MLPPPRWAPFVATKRPQLLQRFHNTCFMPHLTGTGCVGMQQVVMPTPQQVPQTQRNSPPTPPSFSTSLRLIVLTVLPISRPPARTARAWPRSCVPGASARGTTTRTWSRGPGRERTQSGAQERCRWEPSCLTACIEFGEGASAATLRCAVRSVARALPSRDLVARQPRTPHPAPRHMLPTPPSSGDGRHGCLWHGHQ